MTNDEAIKYLRQLYPQGGHCWLDEQRIEAIGMAIEALSQSVTKTSDQEKAAETHRLASIPTKPIGEDNVEDAALVIANCYGKHWQQVVHGFILGARWQKQQIMKEAVDAEAFNVIVHAETNEVQYAVQYPVGTLPHIEGDKVKISIIKEAQDGTD